MPVLAMPHTPKKMRLIVIIGCVLAVVNAFHGRTAGFTWRRGGHARYVRPGTRAAFSSTRWSERLKTQLASTNVGSRDDGEQFQPVVYVTDEQLGEWLEDMIYSGDVSGYMLRNSKDVVNQDFFEYVGERVSTCEDPDERKVFEDVYAILKEKLRLTDGLLDSGVVFENRLDKILFTAPNLRRNLIEEKLDEMTDGFVEYVQSEMKTTMDSDSKVVLASILQMIGQLKNSDLLGKNANVLKEADASLGEQFAKKADIVLQKDVVGERNEIILASLMFSQNDILEDVLNNVRLRRFVPNHAHISI